FQHFHRSDESVSGFARSSPSRHNAHPRPENASPMEDALDDGVNFIGNALDFSRFDRHALDFFCCDQKPLARPTATRRYHSSFGNAYFLIVFLPIPFVYYGYLYGYWTPRLILPPLLYFFWAAFLLFDRKIARTSEKIAFA